MYSTEKGTTQIKKR